LNECVLNVSHAPLATGAAVRRARRTRDMANWTGLADGSQSATTTKSGLGLKVCLGSALGLGPWPRGTLLRQAAQDPDRSNDHARDVHDRHDGGNECVNAQELRFRCARARVCGGCRRVRGGGLVVGGGPPAEAVTGPPAGPRIWGDCEVDASLSRRSHGGSVCRG
jgi:hypothetical protein